MSGSLNCLRKIIATSYTVAVLGTLCTAASTTILAQDAPAASNTTEKPDALAEIVVTGSRIMRLERDYAADSPIVTLKGDTLTNASQPTVDSMLQRMPQFTGSSGGTGQNSTTGGTGLATLNLRNLGDNRNLVLLDGRRMQPSSNTFVVDVNSLPVGIIDNVEVITGGASAVYGSDAIAGVVNFKLKHRFEGIQVDVHGGESKYGDYGNEQVSLLGGTNIADGRGNFMVALDYTNRDATLQRDRPFFQRAMATGAGTWTFSFLGTGYTQPAATNPFNPAVLAAQVGAASLGTITPNTRIGFNSDGTLYTADNPVHNYKGGVYPQNPLFSISPTGLVENGNYSNFATSPLKRYSAFTRFEYELGDSVNIYAQVLSTRYTVEVRSQGGAAAQYWGVNIPRDAAHPVAAPLATLLDSRTNPAAPWYFEQFLDGGPGDTQFNSVVNTNQTTQYIVGFNGKLPFRDWTWDIYGSHGNSQIDSAGQSGQVLYTRYAQLLTAPNYGQGYVSPGSGALVCTSGMSPWLGQGNVSQDCWNYLNAHSNSTITQGQDVIEASSQGRILPLPAGDLSAAMGADYRRNTYSNRVDQALQPADYATPIGACAVCANDIGFASIPSAGAVTVWEAYTELLVPLLKDLPAMKSLEMDLGYRFSDYASSGGVSSFKADLNWNMAGGFRFRGGFERAVRAPNPIELFVSRTPVAALGTGIDPCVNVPPFIAAYGNSASNPHRAQVQQLCASLVPGATAANFAGPYVGSGVPVYFGSFQGNPNLRPETANTATAGLVFAPSDELFLGSRLSSSLDYYRIDVKDAISYLSPVQTYQACFNANGLTNPNYDPNNPFCRSILRSPWAVGGTNLNVLNTYQNQGGIKTQGLDFQVDWGLPLGPGRLSLNALANYLLDYKIAVVPGSPFVDYANSIDSAGVAYFRWRLLFTPSYNIGPVSVSLRWKHLPGTKDVTCVASPNACLRPTDAYNLLDLFGGFVVNDHIRFTAGIDNLLNKDPPVVGGTLGNTNLGEYDLVGRTYWAGVRIQF